MVAEVPNGLPMRFQPSICAPVVLCSVTRVGETVGGEVLRHVIHETLVVHRACAAVGVEADGVREGDEGALGDEAGLHPADGDGAAGSVIFMAINSLWKKDKRPFTFEPNSNGYD